MSVKRIRYDLKDMDKQRLSGIIRKYLRGELSDEERARLMDLILELSAEEADELYNLLGEEIDELNDAEHRRLQKMLRMASLKTNKKKMGVLISLSPLFKVAACLLIASAVLALLFVKNSPFLKSADIAYIIKETGEAKRTKLMLPDGSEVWLNAHSQLKYARQFKGDQRSIYLKGEAFFSVANDKSKPFIVFTEDGLYTRVLGTSFNVNAYPGFKDIQIAVVSGKVAVGKGSGIYRELAGKQQLTFNLSTGKVSVGESDNQDAWIRGELIFNRKPLHEVITVLEKTYNVKISLAGDIPETLRCTGTFSTDQEAEEIIRTLCRLYQLEYFINHKTISIRKENL